MQTIITKRLPFTNTRGSRIKAHLSNTKKSITIPYPADAEFIADAHWKAAEALINKHLPYWRGEDYIQGETDNGYVFVAAYGKRRTHENT